MFGLFRKYEKLLDRELIALFKSKQDMNALGVLFSRYSHLVAAIAVGILKDEHKAKDVVQEIFEVVVQDLKKYDVKNFNSWIYSVTKFHCFKVKKQAVVSAEDFDVEDEYDADEAFDNELHLQKRVDLLHKAMNEIKPNHKQCVELFYMKGYSYKEIVEETGHSINEVKSYIQNGKRNLKLILDKNE